MPERRFRYLSHTADISFVAYGGTFKSALENAALALLNVMLDVRKIERARIGTKRRGIAEKATSREDLAWFLLQDVLSIVDAEKLNAFGMKVENITETGSGFSAKAEHLYKPIEKDLALLSVKAVTPSGLTVEKRGSGYSIKVIADV